MSFQMICLRTCRTAPPSTIYLVCCSGTRLVSGSSIQKNQRVFAPCRSSLSLFEAQEHPCSDLGRAAVSVRSRRATTLAWLPGGRVGQARGGRGAGPTLGPACALGCLVLLRCPGPHVLSRVWFPGKGTHEKQPRLSPSSERLKRKSPTQSQTSPEVSADVTLGFVPVLPEE